MCTGDRLRPLAAGDMPTPLRLVFTTEASKLFLSDRNIILDFPFHTNNDFYIINKLFDSI